MGLVNPTFKTNNFNKLHVLTPLETYVNDIIMLLFGKKGFYPSIPSLGMNISQYLYMFIDDINVSEIKSELARECSEFLEKVQNDDFNVLKTEYRNRVLLIFQLPVITDKKQHSVSIGITTDEYGRLMYNFVENKTQVI